MAFPSGNDENSRSEKAGIFLFSEQYGEKSLNHSDIMI